MQNSLSPFFNPTSVAIIGASSNPNKLSFGIFRNLTQYGYQGKVYPINPNAKEILGLTCYPDVLSVPGEIDLAVSVVSAPLTPDVIEACGKRGIKAVTIISGGFREVGETGVALEKRCVEIARKYNMRLVGPNCVGTMDLYSGLNTTFIHGVPDKGGIGFLSQSGAICGGIVDYVRSKKVGFSNFVSLGNEADVTETDVIEYLADDPNTRVITAYVEAIQEGRRFVEVVREVSKKKPVVLLKAGKTNAGARAVSSHTGSIAGSMAAYHAAFQQTGVIEVDTVVDLFDVALALDFQPIPAGKNAVILTNSGGPAALASDGLAAHGLQLAFLSEDTQNALREGLNPSAQVSNPVDMLGGAEPVDYSRSFARIVKDENAQVILPILVPQALIKPEEVAKALVDESAECRKPILCCFMGDEAVKGARNVLHEHRIPMYTFPESLGRILGAMSQYGEWRNREEAGLTSDAVPRRDEVAGILDRYYGQASIGERDTRPILQAYDIPIVPGGFARDADEAVHLAQRIGGRVVMKIVSPQIIHKSDAGGIRLNLMGDEEVRSAYSEMVQAVRAFDPTASFEGVLIEAMAPKGTEVIVGMRRDPSFGPLLMFGLGGIYVELFTDVAFRIAPVDENEARRMIMETKAGRLLSGFRGSKPADIQSLISCIQKLGVLALSHAEIQEIEMNPLVVYPEGEGALALDCRVILGGNG